MVQLASRHITPSTARGENPEFDYRQLLDALWMRTEFIFGSDMSVKEKFQMAENALFGAALTIEAFCKQFSESQRSITMSPLFPSNPVYDSHWSEVPRRGFRNTPRHLSVMGELTAHAEALFSGDWTLYEKLLQFRSLLRSAARRMQEYGQLAETDADFEWSL